MCYAFSVAVPGKRMWRFSLAVGLVLVGAAVGSFVTGIVIWSHTAFGNGPPIAQGLQGATWAEQDADFDRRLRAQFPVGASAENLVAGLIRQGFHPDWRLEDPHVHRAVGLWSDFPCNMIAKVSWTEDGKGLITSIDGFYHEAGCL